MLSVRSSLARLAGQPGLLTVTALLATSALAALALTSPPLSNVWLMATGLCALVALVSISLLWFRCRVTSAKDSRLDLSAKLFEYGNEGFIVTAPDQRIVMVNKAFTRITGYSEAEALGQTPALLSSGRHDAAFYEAMWSELASTGSWQGEVWNRRKDGSIYPEWLSISQVCNEEGEVCHYIGIISDISGLKHSQEQVQHLAYYDPLTNLPNRLLLDERAHFALGMSKRSGKSMALVFLDLDHFKQINDSLGHHVGDELLIGFARRLALALRDQDTLARRSGDEFILVLPDTDANGAAHTAQKLLNLLKAPFQISGYSLSVTCSLGIALYPSDGHTLDELYTSADIAMYRAKQDGRGVYRFFTSEQQAKHARTMTLESALKQAVEQQQFEVYYQPQYNLADGTLVGIEALLRWHHAELGDVPPQEFIPIAETNGLILPLGEWVLREATQQLNRWSSAGLTPVRMAVNLSTHQFNQNNFFEILLGILSEAELGAEYLELELTETAAMQDAEHNIRITNQFTRAGISLSMDDFGIGYSSVSCLRRFNLRTLKIDMSLVRDLDSDPDDQAIVGSIITLARGLGLKTIAEGVETEAQANYLRTLGCHYAQGYLYGKPLPARDLEQLLRERENCLEQP
ncbi:bifunctional diguanylate cyclase/phosphodiesterase [Marinimicrobium sp. ABcell2]|uniref:putative bifunctional diguanylate cyclase/phosphodiesterase n=1 Tax=Marinimicrobium sp. ABcell2 TaxID=3069751 RepID=UPI0027B72A30|nr:EAL domain-containing protein [Marinimicrobium sp. ABcell2]MDQ2075992.1 EAL domain-containing protein [Marinimicrobium sp. ABcell2]